MRPLGIAAIVAHPAPKNSECKNTLENFPPRFFGPRRHPFHRLCSKEPNYQRGVLPITPGATEGYFEGRTPREVYKSGLVLARQ